MKGGAGTMSGGIAAGRVGGSGGRVGSPGGVLVSLSSPESSRFAGGSAKFSSRGLSMFNHSVLAPRPSMFDKTRPFVSFPRAIKPAGIESQHVSRPSFDRAKRMGRERPRVSSVREVSVLRPKAQEKVPGSKLESIITSLKKADVGVKPMKKEQIFGRPVQKRAEIKLPKHRKLSDMIVVLPATRPDQLIALRRDIREARKSVYTTIAVRRVSYDEAQRQMAQILVEKYKALITLSPQPQLQPEEEAKVKAKTAVEIKPKVMVKTQQKEKDVEKEKTETAVLNPEDEKKNKKKNKPEEFSQALKKRVFKFARDLHATNARIEKIISVFDALQRNRAQSSPGVTGEMVAYELSKQPVGEAKSQMVEFSPHDHSYDEVISRVSKLGTIESASDLVAKAEHISYAAPAVLLTFKDKGAQVSEKDAARVHGGSLDGKEAFFQEHDRSIGELKLIAGNVYYLPKTRNMGTEVGNNWIIPRSSSDAAAA